jgi:hypothetical protein
VFAVILRVFCYASLALGFALANLCCRAVRRAPVCVSMDRGRGSGISRDGGSDGGSGRGRDGGRGSGSGSGGRDSGRDSGRDGDRDSDRDSDDDRNGMVIVMVW